MGTNATTNNTMGAVALPVSMDLSVLSMGTLDIKPIPTKIIKCYVVQDSYVNSSYPNMNYGLDGLVGAGGGYTRGYLGFDLTTEKASFDIRDLIEARLQMYSESIPDSYPMPFYEIPGITWYENDINWINAPQVPTPLTPAGSWAQVVESGYSPSSSLKSLVATTDIINLAFLENDVNHSMRVSSKDGVSPPYIELEVIDRAAMAMSTGMYDASIKLSPILNSSDYAAINFNLISNNLVEDFEVRLGVTAITQASNYNLSITEYPLEFKVIQKNSLDIPAQVGVSTSAVATSSTACTAEFPVIFFPLFVGKEEYDLRVGVSTSAVATSSTACTAEFPVIFSPKFRGKEDYDLRVGVSAPVNAKADVLSTDHFELFFEPEVNGAFCIPTQVGVSTALTMTASVFSTAEFTMEFNVKQRAELQVPCQLGVSTMLDFVESTLSNVNIPFEMYVPANYYLPFKIDLRAHKHYPMNMDVIPVLMVPFNFNVISPFFPINIEVTQEGKDGIPFLVIPLIRNAYVIPIVVDVRLPATYGFIV